MVTRGGVSDLNGLELSAVCFVRDYVELHFDGPIFRSLGEPIVETQRDRFTHPDPGARDALCGMIGSIVVGATESASTIRIAFEGGGAISVPLESETAGPEVAHLVPFSDGSPDIAGMRLWANQYPDPDVDAGRPCPDGGERR